MSIWATAVSVANAAQLRVFGVVFNITPPGGTPSVFTALWRMRQPLDTESSFEAIWTRMTELPFTPSKGASVLAGTTSYIVHDVKPDEDPDSDGITLYLNRRKPNA